MSKPDVTGYMSSMALADRLYCQRLISKKEFLAFEEKMRQKYGLEKASIYRDSRCYVSASEVTSHTLRG
jgi:hypothetical protein